MISEIQVFVTDDCAPFEIVYLLHIENVGETSRRDSVFDDTGRMTLDDVDLTRNWDEVTISSDKLAVGRKREKHGGIQKKGLDGVDLTRGLDEVSISTDKPTVGRKRGKRGVSKKKGNVSESSEFRPSFEKWS
jgi:hypothetical protein